MARKTNVFNVSQSKMSTWRRCKYAYFLRYVEKLRKKFKGRPLRFGSIVHEFLEADANGMADPFNIFDKALKEQGKMFASQREEVEETIEDARTIMMDYEDYWEEAPKHQQFTYLRRKGKASEHEFNVELCDGIMLNGRLDGLASLVSDKSKLLVEDKTFKAMPNDDHRWRNLQSNIYKFALDKLDINIERICWNYIRSKPPSLPKMLKDGSVSNKRLDSLPFALKMFEKRQKLKLPARMIETARGNRKNYFIRTFSAPRKKTVDLLVADFIETAREMSEQHGRVKSKTIDRHCEWCDYEPICRAEMTGSDRDFIIKKDYEKYEKDKPEIQQV